MTLVYRSCARCRKELTDAASMEMGIGPICRNLDNALLAQQIPANLDEARRLATEVLDPSSLPAAVIDTALRVLNDISEAARGSAIFAGSGGWKYDGRATVKRIEWIVSHLGDGALRDTFIEITTALGYVALANVWSDPSAIGKSTCRVYLRDGRLYYEGPKNRAARFATKDIGGARFHREGYLGKPAWSVAASAFDKFKLMITTRYPLHEIEMSVAEVIESGFDAVSWDALGALAAKVAPSVPVAAAKPTIEVKVRRIGSKLCVLSPYNASFVARVKAECAGRWNGEMKWWQVGDDFAPRLLNIIRDCYGVEVEVPAAA